MKIYLATPTLKQMKIPHIKFHANLDDLNDSHVAQSDVTWLERCMLGHLTSCDFLRFLSRLVAAPSDLAGVTGFM